MDVLGSFDPLGFGKGAALDTYRLKETKKAASPCSVSG